MRRAFDEYLENFEIRVVVAGVRLDLFGKDEMVAIRDGRLRKTKFGEMMREHIHCDFPLVIDYYGYSKKSVGFIKFAKELNISSAAQVRMLECRVVHFASIKIEQIVEVAPNLVAEFPKFKAKILRMRGFKKRI